jgi:DNA-binding transcriptional ArsR family regulator
MHHISKRFILEFKLYREFFRALSNRTRFVIVELLREKPYYVGEIVERLGFEQSRVSHNLGCLLNCGFVHWEWQGKNKVYRLHPDLLPILNAIDKHLARYAPALESCQVLEGEAKQAVFPTRSSGPRQSQRRRRRRSTVKA